MGFFSWDCKHCGQSIRGVTGFTDAWMKQAIVLGEDGSIFRGEYDGYGQISGMLGEISLDGFSDRFSIYHLDCWEAAGQPVDPGLITGFSTSNGFSRHAVDQGFFVGAGGSPVTPLSPFTKDARSILSLLDGLSNNIRNLLDAAGQLNGILSIDTTITKIGGYQADELIDDLKPLEIKGRIVDICQMGRRAVEALRESGIQKQLGRKAYRVAQVLAICANGIAEALNKNKTIRVPVDRDMLNDFIDDGVPASDEEMRYFKLLTTGSQVLSKIENLYLAKRHDNGQVGAISGRS